MTQQDQGRNWPVIKQKANLIIMNNKCLKKYIEDNVLQRS